MERLLDAKTLEHEMQECLNAAIRNNRMAYTDWGFHNGSLDVTVFPPTGPITKQTVQVTAQFRPSGELLSETVPYSRVRPTDFSKAARMILRKFLSQVK